MKVSALATVISVTGMNQVGAFQLPAVSSRSFLFNNKHQLRCTQAMKRIPSFYSSVGPLSAAVLTPDDTTIDAQDQMSPSSSSEEGIGAWLPLASAKGLEGLGPQRITIMGIDLVVWHTATAKSNKKNDDSAEEMVWTAQVDACAHRLAPLSQGRVNPNTNCIECPYHGWNFDSDGMVTQIPQLEPSKSIESVRSQGGHVQTFPVHAVHDLLFVFLPSSLHGEMFPQSLLPENYYPHLYDQMKSGNQIYVRELPYSLDFLVENFMDPAHIPFAHHKLQSTRDDGSPIAMAEILSNFTTVETSFKDMTGKRTRDAYASFQRPSCYHYGEYKGEGIDEPSGKPSRVPQLCIWMAPIEAGKCRVFFQAPKIKLPAFIMHAGSNRFLNTDTWLHDTEREVVKRKEAGLGTKKLAGMDYIYASQSDVGVSAFRKWWKKNGMIDSPPNTFGMATMKQLGSKCLSRREQIDPWEGHTKNCSSCRKALGNMKKGQKAFLFLAVASGLLGSRAPVVGILSAGICLYGRNFLKKFATALEGNPEMSGIGDRSVAASAD